MNADTWRELPDWDKARLRWRLMTDLHPTDPRPQQITPVGTHWTVWLNMAGRGYGKTRVGAEDFSDFLRAADVPVRLGVMADKYSTFRDICMEGESGLLSILPPSALRGGSLSTAWNRSIGELHLSTGSQLNGFSAEKPDSPRGYQFHRLWCEEVGKWPYPREAWDIIEFCMRLGSHPQTIVTTTPKPIELLADLASRKSTVLTQGSTFDNKRNLPAQKLDEWEARYGGSRLGRQELYGELLTEYEGALWRRDMIQHVQTHPPLVRVAVGVDPSTWSPESDPLGLDDAPKFHEVGRGLETGIVAAGVDAKRDVYVLNDLSMRAGPLEWARAAVVECRRLNARLVPEVNIGGWVLSVIATAQNDGGAPVRVARDINGKPGIKARDGKRIRAEPVAAYYEAGHVFHVGSHGVLEDQQCSWDPNEAWSPDRIDALVHAITYLEPWKRRQMSGATAAGRVMV